MDVKGFCKGITAKLEKYKFAVLIVVIGIVLMLLPDFGTKEDNIKEQVTTQVENSVSVQDELEDILSHMKGVGKVEVMLKEQVGEEKVYQYNEDVTESESSTTTKIDVVTVTDSERNESGLIKKIISPTYMGAIVICQGADDPTVKYAVAEAVSKVTGLGMNRIVVLKMK